MMLGNISKISSELRFMEHRMRASEILMGCFFFITLSIVIMVREPCADIHAYLLILLCVTGIMMIHFCLDDTDEGLICDENFYYNL